MLLAGARRRSRLVGRGRDASPASMMPRAPLPLGTHSGVTNATIVTVFRPDTHPSIDTETDPNMRAIRVAGDPKVPGLCGALADTPIRVRLHHQLPADRVPDILGDDSRTARLLEHIALARLGHPGKRLSDNCRTLSRYVAISTGHGKRTGTIACSILNRCSVFLPHTKMELPARHPFKERAWVRWPLTLVHHISAKL